MKKAIVLILLAAQFLFCFGVCAETAESEIDRFAADTLISLDIIKSAAKPEREVTRGEFADMIVKFFAKYDTEKENMQPVFYDVPVSGKYYKAVTFAVNYGLVKGYAEKKFNPEKIITVDEAVQISARALGVNDSVSEFINYRSVAADERLYRNIDKYGNLTYKNAINLLFNLLDANCYGSDEIRTDGSFEFKKKDEKLGHACFDLSFKDGIIAANSLANLNGTKPMSKGRISIDSEEYYSGDTDIENYLGYNVRACVRYSDDTDRYTVLSYKINDSNKIITIDADDISSSTTSRQVVYKLNNSKKTENIYSVDFIYNGKYYADYTDADIKIKNGTVTLIDNNNDGKTDVVKVDSFRNVFVSAVNSENETIYDAYGFDAVLLGDKDYSVTDIYGTAMNLSVISKNDVISVYESKDYGSDSYVKIVKSTTSPIKGKVTSIENSSEGEDAIIMIDGTEYTLSGEYIVNSLKYPNKMPNVKVGLQAEFYFDFQDKIVAAAEDKNNSDNKYGYLVKLAQKADMSENVELKIFSQDGQFVICTAEDKIKINDVRKDSSDLLRIASVYDKNSGRTNPQVIRYKLNENKKLSEIEYAPPTKVIPHTNNIKTLTYNDTLTDAAMRSYSKIGGRYLCDTNTVIFSVPNDVENEKGYKILSGFGNDHTIAQLQVYNASVNYVAGALVTQDVASDNFTNAVQLVMIKNITKALNDEEEEIDLVTGYQLGREIKFSVTDEDILDGVGKGDLAQVLFNSLGEATAMKVLFKNAPTPADPVPYMIYRDKYAVKSPGNQNKNYDNQYEYSPMICAYGRCLSVEGDHIITVAGYDADRVFSNQVYWYSYDNVFTYDIDKLTVKQSSFAEIVESSSYDNLNGSVVFVVSMNDRPREIYIIKGE